MNWYEHTDSDTMTAVLELPGLKPENITIILSDNKLTIRANLRTSDLKEGESIPLANSHTRHSLES